MIYRSPWVIKLSRHAKIQADVNFITTDMVEATLKTGRMKWFAKNNVKFICTYKRGNVICVGERKSGNEIKILTIEWG